jgi:hypothetical protein
MSEATEGLRAAGFANQHVRAERRKDAAEQYREAQRQAEQNGMTLQRFSEAHYRLTSGTNVWDIHPGNQRIRRTCGACPFIFGLGDQWGLIDVVKQAATTIKAWREAKEEAKRKRPTS